MTNVYSNLKFLSYFDHIEALRDQKVVAPVHVRIKPINWCNHDCWYCAYRVDNLQLGKDMELRDAIPPAKMFEIIDDIIDMKVEAVTFSGGGEPLVYKALPECVERLAAGGVKVATLTNGENLKGRMAEAFAKHGTWVRVSTDAWDDASYSKARGVADGTFSKVAENMRKFVKRGTNCVLGVSFIISQKNHEHVYDICSFFKDIGVSHVKLSGVVTSNDINENNEYRREIMASVEPQIAKAKELSDQDFSVVDHYHELEGRFEKSYATCPYMMFLTVIGADQTVYTCQDKAYTERGTLGSIRDRSFKDFWYSEENRKTLFSFDPSVSCCHHCVSNAKNLSLHEFLSLDPEHTSFV